MERLRSKVDTSSEAFAKNRDAMEGLVSTFRERTALNQQGGRGRERQRELGKMFVRERIDLLIDKGTPFLELSGLAAWTCMTAQRPAAVSSPVSATLRVSNARSWRMMLR